MAHTQYTIDVIGRCSTGIVRSCVFGSVRRGNPDQSTSSTWTLLLLSGSYCELVRCVCVLLDSCAFAVCRWREQWMDDDVYCNVVLCFEYSIFWLEMFLLLLLQCMESNCANEWFSVRYWLRNALFVCSTRTHMRLWFIVGVTISTTTACRSPPLLSIRRNNNKIKSLEVKMPAVLCCVAKLYTNSNNPSRACRSSWRVGGSWKRQHWRVFLVGLILCHVLHMPTPETVWQFSCQLERYIIIETLDNVYYSTISPCVAKTMADAECSLHADRYSLVIPFRWNYEISIFVWKWQWV